MKKIFKLFDIEFLLLLVALVSVSGAGVYRLYSLNNTGIGISVAISLALAVIILLLKRKFNNISTAIPGSIKLPFKSYILLVLNLVFLAASFYVLADAGTTEAIISPWQTVPPLFFALLGASFLLLFINTAFSPRLGLVLASLHLFLAFAVAIIVYKIGFGFDPFIHQATEKLIAKFGVVEPKPFYYLGQYSLIVILNKIFGLSLLWLDRLLVPILAAIGLPALFWRILKKWFGPDALSAITLPLLLILPFSFFVISTPQNLAFLFLLFAVIYGLKCSNNYELVMVFVFAFAALASQPIAGIPALLFACLLTVYHSDTGTYKKHLVFLVFLLVVLALPFAFYYVENVNQIDISPSSDLKAETAQTSLALPDIKKADSENLILNLVYFFGFNRWILMIALIGSGIVIALYYRKSCNVLAVYLIMAAGLFLSFLLTSHLSFSYLIDYERSDFTTRILADIGIFLVPFILLAVYGLVLKASRENLFIRSSAIVFSVLLMVASLYLAYPRFDNYFNSHIYSVSASDIEAVDWIDRDAGNDFVVLANQQVSAAALKEFGFKKYYDGDIFYYPIPTGGILYQYYLDMVYETPDRITMEGAMDRVGVHEAYFVLNKYWWASDKIKEEAKLGSDSWQEFSNGEVTVFKYSRQE